MLQRPVGREKLTCTNYNTMSFNFLYQTIVENISRV